MPVCDWCRSVDRVKKVVWGEMLCKECQDTVFRMMILEMTEGMV